MSEIIPQCELGACEFFKLREMSSSPETCQYIFDECRTRLREILCSDPTFNETDCPQAALTAAVIIELAVREEEIEVAEE